jgi:hypothetical protein
MCVPQRACLYGRWVRLLAAASVPAPPRAWRTQLLSRRHACRTPLSTERPFRFSAAQRPLIPSTAGRTKRRHSVSGNDRALCHRRLSSTLNRRRNPSRSRATRPHVRRTRRTARDSTRSSARCTRDRTRRTRPRTRCPVACTRLQTVRPSALRRPHRAAARPRSAETTGPTTPCSRETTLRTTSAKKRTTGEARRLILARARPARCRIRARSARPVR